MTFALKKMVDWRTAIPLLIVTTIAAPIGVWLLKFTSTELLWWLYVAVLLFLAWRMAFPPKQDDSAPSTVTDRTREGGWCQLGNRVFAGLLGVGPGFLMMPTLVLLGFAADSRRHQQRRGDSAVLLGVHRPPARGPSTGHCS